MKKRFQVSICILLLMLLSFSDSSKSFAATPLDVSGPYSGTYTSNGGKIKIEVWGPGAGTAGGYTTGEMMTTNGQVFTLSIGSQSGGGSGGAYIRRESTDYAQNGAGCSSISISGGTLLLSGGGAGLGTTNYSGYYSGSINGMTEPTYKSAAGGGGGLGSPNGFGGAATYRGSTGDSHGHNGSAGGNYVNTTLLKNTSNTYNNGGAGRIKITPLNAEPTLTITSPQNPAIKGNLSVDVKVSDFEGGPLTVKLLNGAAELASKSLTSGTTTEQTVNLTTPITALPEGAKSFTISVSDGLATTTAVYNVVIDRLLPTITLTPSTTAATGNNVTISAAVNGTGSEIVLQRWCLGEQTGGYVAESGVDFTGSFQAITNGIHTVYAKDRAGNDAVKTITVSNIDKELPSVTLSTGNYNTASKTYTATLDYSDGQSSVTEKKYGLTNTADIPATWNVYGAPLTVSAEGTWYIHYRAVDSVGNVSTGKFGPFSLGTENPASPVITRNPDTDTATEPYKIYVTDAVDAATGLYKTQYRLKQLGNEEWKDYTGLVEVTKTGLCEFQAKTVDILGRESAVVSVPLFQEGDSVLLIRDLKGVASENSIRLSWDSTGSSATYEVETNSGVVITPKSTNALEVYGLESSKSYTYRVRAKLDNDYGPWSEMITVKTSAPYLMAPTHVQYTKTNRTITIQWDALSGAKNYEVDVDGEIIPLQKELSYTVEGLSPNSSHIIRVRGVNADGFGEWSLWQIEKTTFIPPDPVLNLKGNVDKNSVSMSWDAAKEADSYDLEINFCKGAAVLFTESQSCQTPALDFVIEDKTVNCDVKVRSKNAAGVSPWTEITDITPLQLSTPAIEWVDAENADLMIQWGAVEGAYKYEIQQDGTTIGESVERLYKIDFTDAENHQYLVRGKDTDGGYSNWSEPIESKKIPRRPDWVDTVTPFIQTNQVELKWQPVAPRTVDPADIIKGYDVEVDGYVVQVKDTKYLHDELDPFTEHKYRVRAVTDYREGFWTDYIKVKTPAGILPKIYETQMANKSHTAIMTWDPVPGAEWYEVEVNGTVIKGYGATRYEHHGIKSFEENTYRVRACNRYGKGPWSHLVINCAIPAQVKKKEPVEMALTASDITDFKKYRLEVYYPSSVRVEDLCAYSVGKEVSDGMVPGTEIEILNHSPGRAEFLVHKIVDDGYSWAGIINNIVFKGRQTGGATLTYTVHDIEGDNPPVKEHDLKHLEKENFEKANPYAVEGWHN